MPYRPQYVFAPTPEGFHDEEFEYYFDSINTPALAIVPSEKVPLPLQDDADFILRGIEISGNVGDFYLRFWTPTGDPIGQSLIEADRAYGSTVAGLNPVGRLPVPMQDEIFCPAGAVLMVDTAQV